MPEMFSRTCVSLACEANRFCLRWSERCSPLHSNAVGSKRFRMPLSDARNRLETIGTERTAATCYGSRMRYFNAREITRPEAQHIRRTSSSASQSSIVVISLGSRWFDVRGLKEQELHRFVEQLLREELMADSGTRH